MYIFLDQRFSWLWTLVTIWVGVMIVWNSGIYFSDGPQPQFFWEKGEIADLPLWRAAFYVHVIGASVCLLTGIPLMFTRLLRYRRAHRVLGYVYVNSVLWAAAPAALVMSPFAKGGPAGALGFAVLGGLWWWTTWSGYLAIRQNDLSGHIRGMVRSYALALSAVTFRLFQAAFYFLGLDNHSNYIVSLWLSLFASIWLAETCIYARLPSTPSRAAAESLKGVLP